MLKVAVADPWVRASDVLLREVLRLEAETDSDRVTVPLKPFKLVTVMVENVVDDLETVREDGFALMRKSDTMTRSKMEWTREPLVPVIFAV